MTFLGHHLTTLDYIVWTLWLAWCVSLGLLVNECCKDLRAGCPPPESSQG